MGGGQRRGLAGRWQLISMETSRQACRSAGCGCAVWHVRSAVVGGVGRQLHGVGGNT
jgi:hypothetical protein